MKVFGASMDDAASHKRFIEKNDLPFPLVVDDGTLADAFEVPHRLGYASRQSVLIGRDGRIRKIWRDVRPAEHAAEVLVAASASAG